MRAGRFPEDSLRNRQPPGRVIQAKHRLPDTETIRHGDDNENYFPPSITEKSLKLHRSQPWCDLAKGAAPFYIREKKDSFEIMTASLVQRPVVNAR